MIIYRNCNEVELEDIYEAFKIGFSDYMIKMDLSKELFIQRFFGPEGNHLETSFIAYHDHEAIGLILGGIKVYEGIKTLRCGTLCIHPDYRGTDVAHQLFKYHNECAIHNHCRQLFLEVIVGNDRAIQFYKKKGYMIVYDIAYFSHSCPNQIMSVVDKQYDFKRIDIEELKQILESFQAVHINWQNDLDSMKKLDSIVHYGIFEKEILIAGLSIQVNGKISFIGVRSEFRLKGLGKSLLAYATKDLNLNKLVINFTNNMSLMGFVHHIGFSKDTISQYEMIKPL